MKLTTKQIDSRRCALADTRLALPALQVLAHFGRMLLVGIIGIELNIGFSLSLSSISAILSGTIGIHYGHVLIHFKGHAERLRQWVSMGFILLIVAIILLFTDAIPINKQLYSFSYVCFTAGAAGIVFSGFYVLIDVWGLRPPFLFLEWIGMNAMLVYVMAAQGIFEGFINGWYYKSPDNTLVYWIQEHVFNDVWHSERVGTLLYVIFAQITFWAVVSGVLHKLGINWKL